MTFGTDTDPHARILFPHSPGFAFIKRVSVESQVSFPSSEAHITLHTDEGEFQLRLNEEDAAKIAELLTPEEAGAR